MKYMVLKGNVLGGHHIRDLGLHVEYQKEVMVPVDRASWSRDLAEAIQKKTVIKVRYHDNTPPPRAPASRSQAVPVSPVKKVKKPLPPAPPSPQEQEAKELREMNKTLLETIDKLADSQAQLMEKLNTMIDQGPIQKVVHVSSSSESTAPVKLQPEASTQSEPEYDEWDDDDDYVMFIPSKIRDDNTKVSDNFEAQEETKAAGGKMDEAAQALANMKGSGRKRRSKKKSSE